MRLPDDPDKFTSRFKYVELMRYIPRSGKFVREKDGDEPILFALQDIPAYLERHDNTGIYSSVLQYDGNHFADATPLGPVYFDLDADGEPELVRGEVSRLVEHLLSYIPASGIRLYFSGKKGYHVECEPIALGVSPNDDLPGVFRTIATDIRDTLGLTTMDFAVYDWRRMWRHPNTKHQSTGLYKVECMSLFGSDFSLPTILDWASEPRHVDIPEQVFDPRANSWYREYTYKFEQQQQSKKQHFDADMVNRFLTDGSSNLRHYDGERMFDRASLLKNCSAVRDLDKKARTEHFLSHYERLFLCSLLSYSDEAIVYLHEILSKLDDYNFEISNSHIEDWIKRREYEIGGRPFTCQKASEVGISCSDCAKMEPRKKVVKLSSGSYMETEEESAPSPIRWAYSSKRK